MRVSRIVASLAVLAAPALAAQGRNFQPPPDHWITVDSLKQALGLSDAQRSQVSHATEALNAVVKRAAERRMQFRQRTMGQTGGGPPTPEQREAMRPRFDSLRVELQAMQQEADKWYAEIRQALTPEQQAKLDQLPHPVLAPRMAPRGP